MKIALGLLLVLLLCWWLFYQPGEPTDPISAPNTVSRINNVATEKQAASIENTTQTAATFSSEPIALPTAASATKQPAQSYLQLYRDLRLAESCAAIFRSLAQYGDSHDFLKDFSERFVTRSADGLTAPTAEQYQQYEQLLADCLQLEDQISRHNPGPPTARKNRWIEDHLATELLVAKATSTKEQSLKKLRQMIEPWNQQWEQMIKLAQGQLDEDHPEVLAIRQQMDELKAQRSHQRQLLQDAYTLEMVQAHNRQYQQLHQQLRQLLSFDRPEQQQLLDNINQMADEIRTYLYKNDADLFYEAAALLNHQRGYRFINSNSNKDHKLARLAIPYQSEAKQLNLTTGPLAKRNFMVVSAYAHHLLLCGMGEACGPGSPIMRSYCLGSGQIKAHRQACHKDLTSFYFEDYLSPNQQTDVATMYDQLVNIYGL